MTSTTSFVERQAIASPGRFASAASRARQALPRRLLCLALAVSPLAVSPARAQMPDLRAMSGRPLPVADLPNGTVSLRVVRQSPANPVAGVEVTSTTRMPSGEARSGSARTGADGRVTFENLPTGADFQATVTVDGERLDTVRFPLPRTGGARIMLIAGLGPPGSEPPPAAGHGAGAAPGAAQPDAFRMGAPTGTVAPTPELPVGTLQIDLRDAGGQPLVGRKVQLAQVRLKAAQNGPQPEREVGVQEAVSDGAGRATFKDLLTGEAAGYAAVTDHEGLRLGTQPFRMPSDTGMRGQIVALARTSAPSALQLDPRSKVILQVREDSVAVMMALFLRNTSRDIFDAGEEGLVLTLPEGATGAQELEGGEQLDIAAGRVRLRSPIPPDSAASFVTQVRFGYILPSSGASTLELRQRLPVALPEPLILVPAKDRLSLEGPGVRRLPDDRDGEGNAVNIYTSAPVAAAGILNLDIIGVPARDYTGRMVASTLCILFLVAAVVFSGPPRGSDRAGVERASLAQRREKLFAELVALERERKAQPASAEPRAGANGRQGERRRELVGKLELVYRDLAKLEASAA